ncbi:hypothetical protein ACGF1Z_24580 [Streptomyces sp. NPDC048018]|uniref:hypothetical protein n=1 Tax=Streptomyces sp. NPDC048018 TaxID=3365499 RepID=UPI0037190B8B
MGTTHDRTAWGRPAAAALVPLLLTALAACQSGGSATGAAASPTATPVFDVRLDDQLQAATKATTAAGNAAFTSTLRYGSAHGTAVDRASGTQDYTGDAARAERELSVPRGFPAEAADDLGARPGRASVPETYVIKGNRVDYRTRQGGWLRYSSKASMDVVDLYEGILDRAGETAPYGGTLAEVVRSADATKPPVKDADGRRTYELTVPPQTAAPALPYSVRSPLTYDRGAERVALTVVLDAQGRLQRASADYTPVLKRMHAEGVLKGVTSLKAEYTLSGLGTTVMPGPEAGQGTRTEDAEKALTPLTEVGPGACGSTDTGLGGSLGLVRVVPCGRTADVRVFGQVTVKETVQGAPDGVAEREAGERCGTKFHSVPDAWVADARPDGTYFTYGAGSSSSSYTGPDTDVEGTYTCYVQVS